jgi:uncharacterized heparinase superfamily protein
MDQTRCDHVQVFETRADLERLSAEHDGYHRLTDPVTHRRELSYSTVTRVLRVRDRLMPASLGIKWKSTGTSRLRAL